MLSYLYLILVVTPLIVSGVIAFLFSQSLVSLLVLAVGAIAGSILITGSGIIWLQALHREWMESQSAGLIFVPVVLPFLAYTGAIAGTSLVAILSVYSRNPSFWLFQAIAIGLTVVLAGLMPSVLLTFALGRCVRQPWIIVPVSAMGAGIAGASLASQLAHLLVVRLN